MEHSLSPSDVYVRRFPNPFFTVIKFLPQEALRAWSLISGPKAKFSSSAITNPTSFAINYHFEMTFLAPRGFFYFKFSLRLFIKALAKQKEKSMTNYGYINHQVYWNQTYFANKVVLIWLCLVKMRVILGRKKVSINVKSQFVNGGLYLLRIISWVVLCCYGILM